VRGSRNAAKDDPQCNILQLNTERLTANKISVTEQLAYKNFHHRPTADPLHNCRQASDQSRINRTPYLQLGGTLL